MSSHPNILIMGVSASGKTTVARLVAQKLQLPFLEADEFHPTENIHKMSRGEPLNDEDRKPWLEAIAKATKAHEATGLVLACSALKESYRQLLQKGLQEPLQVFYLDGSFEQIMERISKRKNHFMPESLLQSQFEALEIPQNAIRLDIERTPEELGEMVCRAFL